jgi:hypothetical protein
MDDKKLEAEDIRPSNTFATGAVAERFLEAWRSGKAYEETPPGPPPVGGRRSRKGREQPSTPAPRPAVPRK